MKNAKRFVCVYSNSITNNKGITLVALVITIIILIILAGISINMLLGEGGLINKTKQAKENMELATIEEQKTLNTMYTSLATGSGTTYDGIAENQELQATLSNATAKQEHILKPYTAYIDGELKEGTIENRGTLNWNPSESTSLTIEPGYYSGGTISTENAYNAGYNTFDSTRYKVLETGSFNTGNIPISDGYMEVNVTLQNDYTSAQNARFVITSYTRTVGTLALYTNVNSLTVGNTKKVGCINGAGSGYNPAYGAATVYYMIIGYPAE